MLFSINFKNYCKNNLLKKKFEIKYNPNTITSLNMSVEVVSKIKYSYLDVDIYEYLEKIKKKQKQLFLKKKQYTLIYGNDNQILNK